MLPPAMQLINRHRHNEVLTTRYADGGLLVGVEFENVYFHPGGDAAYDACQLRIDYQRGGGGTGPGSTLCCA